MDYQIYEKQKRRSRKEEAEKKKQKRRSRKEEAGKKKQERKLKQ
ncbi:hypothetical protein ACSAZL_10900 [Methanosarcina sp. T3]